MTEQTGQKPPGVDGDLWDTPATNAPAIARLGRWPGDRPAPLKRRDRPKQNGPPRPLSLPTRGARARQAVARQALQPLAATTGAQHAYGVRPPRRGAAAIDQGVTALRQTTAAAWIVAGERPGCCENRRWSWRATPLPLTQRGRSTGLRRGLVDHGARWPTTAGVPPGGLSAPVRRHLVLDGLDAMVHGGRGHRRVHHSTAGRWADDVLGPANARAVCAETVLPRLHALLAARGVTRAPTKTVLTQLSPGGDC